jgi:hypothetical protein
LRVREHRRAPAAVDLDHEVTGPPWRGSFGYRDDGPGQCWL